MIKTYKIDAVHPVAKRVIKSNLNGNEMVELYKELQNAGYEDKNIILETTKIVYEVGDIIQVPGEIYDSIPDNINELEFHTCKDRKLIESKRILKNIFGEKPKTMTGILKAKRLDRSRGQIIVEWHNVDNDEWKMTNVYFLEQFGFEFKEPDFNKISIIESDESLLSEYELIIKHMMIDNHWTEQEVYAYMEPVKKAMGKAEAVFYRP
jgi:hypothetical protein